MYPRHPNRLDDEAVPAVVSGRDDCSQISAFIAPSTPEAVGPDEN